MYLYIYSVGEFTDCVCNASDSRVLAVRVVKVKRECSLVVADCSYLPSTSVPRHHDNVVVLFGSSSKVTPGCGVNIHPPW